MSYTKKLIAVEVTPHNGSPIAFADAVDNGKTVRYGTTVLGQIKHGDKVDSIDIDGNHIVIPYDMVVLASVMEAPSDPLEKPQDDFCVSGGNTTPSRRVEVPLAGNVLDALLAAVYGKMASAGVPVQIEINGTLEPVSGGRYSSENSVVISQPAPYNGHEFRTETDAETGDTIFVMDGTKFDSDHITFIVGTDKYGVAWFNENGRADADFKLCDLGEQPITDNIGANYHYREYYQTYGSYVAIPSDHKFPAVVGDTAYGLAADQSEI